MTCLPSWPRQKSHQIFHHHMDYKCNLQSPITSSLHLQPAPKTHFLGFSHMKHSHSRHKFHANKDRLEHSVTTNTHKISVNQNYKVSFSRMQVGSGTRGCITLDWWYRLTMPPQGRAAGHQSPGRERRRRHIASWIVNPHPWVTHGTSTLTSSPKKV